jgi:phosphohistidine phosphatase SixA
MARDRLTTARMKLYFFRHGKADWPNWNKPDDERPLTKEGAKEVRKVAKLLSRLKVAPLVLTSPLPRASQTAAIAAEVLGVEMREENNLKPGFNAARLAKMLRASSADGIMVVGHEPDFSHTIHELTGGAIKLSKAGVALVDVDELSMKGRLRWLVPPKFALL